MDMASKLFTFTFTGGLSRTANACAVSTGGRAALALPTHQPICLLCSSAVPGVWSFLRVTPIGIDFETQKTHPFHASQMTSWKQHLHHPTHASHSLGYKRVQWRSHSMEEEQTLFIFTNLSRSKPT